MLLYLQPGIIPCNWHPWSLGHWTCLLPASKRRVLPLPCWSRIDPHSLHLHISSRTPWCSLLQLETPTTPTTLCNLSPRAERAQRMQGLEGLPALSQPPHGQKGPLWTSLNSYPPLAALFPRGNALQFINKFLETCSALKFNLLNLLHRLNTKNNYTHNVWQLLMDYYMQSIILSFVDVKSFNPYINFMRLYTIIIITPMLWMRKPT